MPSCVVKSCSNHSGLKKKCQGITFHRFPKSNEVWRKDWIDVIRQSRSENDWIPSKSSVVCSIHFEANDLYTTKRGLLRVVPYAIPKLLLEPPSTGEQQPAESNIFIPVQEIQTRGTSEDPLTIVTSRNCSPIAESSDEGGVDKSVVEFDVSAIGTTGYGDAIVPEGSSRRHEGYRCDVCRGDIVGFRYACVQCVGFDLCGACEARGEHAAHYVLRIPHTKLNSDTRAVIQKIRDQLLKKDVEVSIKTEIKEECHLNQDPDPDPLESTCGDEPRQDTNYQVIKSEENETVSAVTYLAQSEKVQSFTVQSHPPAVLFHQSQAGEDVPHQPPIQSKHPSVTRQQKRRLTLEDSETYVDLAGGVVVKEEVEEEGEAGNYAVYTHCAENSGGGQTSGVGTSTTEPLTSSKTSVPSRAKRKK